MLSNTTLKKWSMEYKKRRSDGASGWASQDSYQLKQNRITEALIEHPVSPTASFLELGCGAGNITLWMASRGYVTFGIDVVPEAIQWASDQAKKLNLTANFVTGNLAHMQMFHEEQFDIVFDGDCFHMITGQTRADCFAEVLRVLKPGGILIAGGNVRDELFHEPESKHIITPDGLEYALLTEVELCQELIVAGFDILCVKHYPKRGSNKLIKECIAIHATKSSKR